MTVRWDGKGKLRQRRRGYTHWLAPNLVAVTLSLPQNHLHTHSMFCTFPTPVRTYAPCDTFVVAVPPLETYKEVNGLLHDFFGLETDGDSTPYTVLYSSR
jgi:hypothetical protein